MMLLEWITNYLDAFSYLGIFVLLLLSGYIIPVPEEIILLLVGYMASAGYFGLAGAIIISIIAVLAGDNIIYRLSSHGSRWVHRLKCRLRHKKLRAYEKLMKNHVGKTVFLSRFVVGLRFLGPLLAGSMKIRWRTFQVFNLIAILIYVPLLVLIGYFFHSQLAAIITRVELARHVVFVLIAIMVALAISWVVNRLYIAKTRKCRHA